MKKITAVLLFFLVCFQFIPITAQDTLKSFNNRWTTELNINPFDGSLSFNNAAGQLKFRYLQPDNKAWRFAITLGYKQNNSVVENVYGYDPYENTNRQKSFLAEFNFGKEKHFNGSRRLSPYIGWELALGFKSSSQKTKEDNETIEIEGAWLNYEQVQYDNSQYYTVPRFDERGYKSIGVNLVMGFDFYMSKDFYFGYELLFGLNYKALTDIDVTNSNNTGGNTSETNYPDFDEETWNFGPKLMNGIRIGFVF